ncbi:MAG: T9SS type A sorting domain-containing protein [Chitinophagaceae bacterium]
MTLISTPKFSGKFLFSLMAPLLVLLGFSDAFGTVITIPSTPGTDTSSFTPTNRRTSYSAARMLFSSSEIGATGTITALGFQKYSGSTSTSINYITIYMRETTSSTLTTSVPSGFPTGYKRVYNSSYIDNSMTSGWTTVNLSTASSDIMTYSGGSNYLDIVIVKTTAETGTTAFPVYNCSTTSGSVSAYYFGTSALGSSFTTTSVKRPNIQLTIDATCAGKPNTGTVTGPSTAVCTATSFTLNATGLTVGTGMHYQWQSRNAGSGSYANMGIADTFASLTTSATVNKDFRLVSICTLSGQSDTTAGFTVYVLNPTTIAPGSDTTFCLGGSVTLSTTTLPGVTYNWFKDATNTGITATSYSATATGVYTVRVSTSSCAGVFSNPINVTVNPLPTATVTALGPTTFCDGLSVTLSANTGTGLTYQWQSGTTDISGATSASYIASTAGTYRVKVTNTATGCVNTSTGITVTVNPTPATPVISGPSGRTSYCAGGSLVLSTTSVSGVSYQWANTGGTISGATSNSYTVSAPSTYTLTATLGSCSKISNSVTVTENPLPVASITPSGTISFCNGDSITITATASSGVNYDWRESGVSMGAPNTNTYVAKATGIYSVKVTNTSTGCSDISATLDVSVITPAVPTIAAGGATEFCQGGSVTLTGTAASGLSLQWQESNTDIAGETATTYIAAASGAYRLKVKNAAGCAAYSSPINVVVNPLPNNNVVVTGGPDICDGSEAILTASATAGYAYQWRKGGVDMTGVVYNPYHATAAGDYSVRITDSKGCVNTSADVTITVKYVRAFYVHPYGNTFFCEGDTTMLATQTGFSSYQWYLDGVYVPGATDTFVYATKKGHYTVTVQDPVNHCFATSPGFSILVIDGPPVPVIRQSGTRLSANVGGGVSYQWYKNGTPIAGATDSFITMSGDALYSVTVTNEANCSRSAEIDLSSTGVNESIVSNYEIRIYPNPTKDRLVIDAPAGLTVSLTDLQGRTLTSGKNLGEIDMRSFATGVYIVRFADEQNRTIATQKVSKVE